MLKTILSVTVLFVFPAAASPVLDVLCAERDAALAAGDHALARGIECQVQAELIARQPKMPELPRTVAPRPGRKGVAGFDPDVLIANEDIRAFDTDYSMDGTMWAAFSTYDSTFSVYKSTDHGAIWQHVFTEASEPRYIYKDIGIVVGEGDSAFIYLFHYDVFNNGSVVVVRYHLDGQSAGWANVHAGTDTVAEFAACRDYSGDNYWLYVVTAGVEPDDWNFLHRSTDYGMTWAITDSFQGYYHPYISAGAGTHIYCSATFPDPTASWVIAGINPAWGGPGQWRYSTFNRSSANLGNAAIAADFTAPESTATVWLAWAEDSARNNDWNVFQSWTTDAGFTWSTPSVIAGGVDYQWMPDLRNYTELGNGWMNLSYISGDVSREVHRRHCHANTPDNWSSPLTVNSNRAGTGWQTVPRLTYSPGSPGTGAGVVFAGNGLNGLYWNAPWFTGVAEGPPTAVEPTRAPTVLSRARLLAELRTSGEKLFDGSGRQVTRLASISPGVYFVGSEGTSKVLVTQ